MDLKIEPKAAEDILAIYDYYEGISEGLGDKFYSEFRAKLFLIRMFPKMYSVRRKLYNLRGAVVKNFPYIALYHVGKDAVHIIAVFSCYQSPAHHKKEIRKRK
ncbi:MAG: type II toxin-antitoxin system RelE/ParE family toxin [Sphingobacteriales bacterium JAD_PAG50586_3]|nr:MAG: type II toxin-antitoxin system RelE/ParE family toxin [Sphingobacteriales bacterium JAD_PAG50586_3]